MKRGDILVASAPGDYGKPRPVIVIQSDRLEETDSILACLVTSRRQHAALYRLPLEPTAENGLRQPSDVMIDKIFALARRKCGAPIGRLTADELFALDRRLAFVVGLSA